MNATQARAIRRGIEYGRRESDAKTQRESKLVVEQTERYIGYLPASQAKLFEKAWTRTMLSRTKINLKQILSALDGRL